MGHAIRLTEQRSEFGKYKILTELGEGGSGVVYLAAVPGPSDFSKLVVLKTLKRSLAADDDQRRMFMQEARLAARLEHASIVQTYEVIEDHGTPVIVMEYLDGQPLSNILKKARGKLPLAIHLHILRDALAGLHHAHELRDLEGELVGLVHRDISPQNVFVTFEGQAKILDFGIAKLTTAHPETQTGVIRGKLNYMPAEQIRGDPVDRRADIYAIGIMLWEAAAGEEVWRGLPEATVMHRVLEGKLPPPSSARAVPEALEKICIKATSTEPEQRYATAAELLSDLEQFLMREEPSVSQREVSRLVSDLFVEYREATYALVQRELGRLNGPSSKPAGGALAEKKASAPAVPRKRALRRFYAPLWAVLAAAAGAALASLWWQPSKGPSASPSATQGVSPAPPPPPAAEPAPERVQIRVSAEPQTAVTYVDGERLLSNPFLLELARGNTQHLLRAEAPGHLSGSKAFTAEQNTDISLALEAEPPPAPRAAKTAPATRHPRPSRALDHTSGSPPPQPNDCSPPYVIDERGTKHFKVECL